MVSCGTARTALFTSLSTSSFISFLIWMMETQRGESKRSGLSASGGASLAGGTSDRLHCGSRAGDRTLIRVSVPKARGRLEPRWPALPLPGPQVHHGADLLQLIIHAVQCAAAELHGRRRSAHDGPLDAERRSEPHDRGGGETDENGAQHVAEGRDESAEGVL